MTSTLPSFPNFISSFKPNNQVTLTQLRLPTTKITATIPARDRSIDFGKYRGKMLGSLPSTYLKWVSKNLRAGDFEPWAKLADQVLQDPVYRDRLEWEFAEMVLNGNKTAASSVSRIEADGAVSQLLEISERFGWDNEDKEGWKRVNFELLGTSKGGRIPRKGSSSSSSSSRESQLRTEKREEVSQGIDGGEKRRERRERARLKREAEVKKGKLGILRKDMGSIVNERMDGDDYIDQDRTEEIRNPFPGREALLKKVINSRRFS